MQTTLRDLSRRIDGLPPSVKEKYAEIYKQWFKASPRRILKLPLKKYNLSTLKVLDFGSAFGSSLIYFGSGSIGIELNKQCVRFAEDVGLPIYPVDIFSENFDSEVPDAAFDAVWCCAVIEHLDSPHSALINLRRKLKDNGLLLLTVPTIPKYHLAEGLLKTIIRMIYGHRELSYTSSDHINAFSKKTVEFMVAKAGFEIIETSIFFTDNLFFHSLANLFFKENWDNVTVVGRKIKDFNYPGKASRMLDSSGRMLNKLVV